MRLTQRFVFRPMLRNEWSLAVLAQQTGGHRHGATRVQDVNYGLAIVRGNLDRRVGPAGGRAADQQRKLKPVRSISRAT